MTNLSTQPTLHTKLIRLSETPAGFGPSEITGHSAEQVRRTAETLAKAGTVIRCKVSPRRVRYFATDELAKQYIASRPSSLAQSPAAAAGSRTKARWTADEPMRITSKTKIFIAPPLPRNVFRTNTYPQF